MSRDATESHYNQELSKHEIRTNSVSSAAAQKIISNTSYERQPLTNLSNASSLNVTGVTANQSLKATKRKAPGESKLDRSLGGNSTNLNHSNIGPFAQQKTTTANSNKTSLRNVAASTVSSRYAHESKVTAPAVIVQEQMHEKLSARRSLANPEASFSSVRAIKTVSSQKNKA